MELKQSSFKKHIINFNAIFFIIIFGASILFVFHNTNTIDSYQNSFQNYEKLNMFYESMKSGNASLRNYLYFDDKQGYKQFEDDLNKGLVALEIIQDYSQTKEEQWRIHLLSNMVRNYQKQVIKTIENRSKDEFTYDYKLTQKSFDLIINTSDEYYNLGADDMKAQLTNMISNRNTFLFTMILFIFSIIILLLYFSFTTIYEITSPIKKILKNIDLIKRGEYNLSKITNSNIEMNQLSLAIDDMANSVRDNIFNSNEKVRLQKVVLEKENESLKKDELLAQSELKLLQNQINPHFLFNTLNLIYKTAYSENAYQTSFLMEKTSELLRYGLDKVNKLSDIKQEINCIKNYNFIQEMRYGERIHFKVEAQKDIPVIKMPGYILQPLVENAVSHGLKDVIEEGDVLVEVYIKDKELIISVSDNGAGMPSEELEKMMMNDFQVSHGNRESMGLYNVTKRLKSYFGKRVSIVVNSFEDCGFEFIIKIRIEGNQEL
ncbi:MAG: histidine kinase [Erysipelotrichaceae bacterium]